MPGAASTLIAVPTYDERPNLAALVEGALAVLPEARILVVDDGSPDGTGALADELAAQDPRIEVLHRPRKEGLGPAYLAAHAIALAQGVERVISMDCDWSHDPRYLPALVEATSTAALAVGSRYVPGGGTTGWGLHRRLLSQGGNLYARWILGLPIRDLTAGFCCYRRDALEAIRLERVRSTGYVFQVEMKLRVWRAGLQIREVPIVFRDREKGISKMTWRIALEAIWRVWQLRWRLGRESRGERRLALAPRQAAAGSAASPPSPSAPSAASAASAASADGGEA